MENIGIRATRTFFNESADGMNLPEAIKVTYYEVEAGAAADAQPQTHTTTKTVPVTLKGNASPTTLRAWNAGATAAVAGEVLDVSESYLYVRLRTSDNALTPNAIQSLSFTVEVPSYTELTDPRIKIGNEYF